jgi:hypothetical protein
MAKGHLEDLDIDGRVTLKQVFKWDREVGRHL